MKMDLSQLDFDATSGWSILVAGVRSIVTILVIQVTSPQGPIASWDEKQCLLTLSCLLYLSVSTAELVA